MSVEPAEIGTAVVYRLARPDAVPMAASWRFALSDDALFVAMTDGQTQSRRSCILAGRWVDDDTQAVMRAR